MAPFLLEEILGKFVTYLIFLLIGFGFGFVLEISGFANSTKLAAQFYFKDQTVLKVMFTAIVVAMVLIFAASGLGLLDYNMVWVNPTYLWPGIIGGLIMGVGFIVGGFCPGTSLVAMATLKLDGLFFVLGALFGIFMFGESVGTFVDFWNSSYMGRFTFMDWLGLETGTVVLIIVLMALFMFWGAEKLEQIFGEKKSNEAPRARYAGAGMLVLAATSVIVIGQPTIADRWNRIAWEREPLLIDREVQIHPGELLDLLHNDKINLVMLDVRKESDYNLFHLVDSHHVLPEEIPTSIAEFNLSSPNTVFVIMSNDEVTSTQVWKTMVAGTVPNVYILENGINGWLRVFSGSDEQITPSNVSRVEESIQFNFAAALGHRYLASDPDPRQYELEYVPKVKLETKKGPTSGGCG